MYNFFTREFTQLIMYLSQRNVHLIERERERERKRDKRERRRT